MTSTKKRRKKPTRHKRILKVRGDEPDPNEDTPDPEVQAKLEREAKKVAKSFKNHELRQTIISVLRTGASIADAARFAGVPSYQVRKWYARGKGMYEGKPATPSYKQFAAEVDKARASAKVLALGTLTAAIQSRHRVKVGETRYKDPTTGHTVIQYQMAEEISPMAKDAALAFLAAVDPKRWGNGRQRVELSGPDGAPIELDAPADVQDTKTRVISILGTIAAAAMVANADRLPHPLELEEAALDDDESEDT